MGAQQSINRRKGSACLSMSTQKRKKRFEAAVIRKWLSKIKCEICKGRTKAWGIKTARRKRFCKTLYYIQLTELEEKTRDTLGL